MRKYLIFLFSLLSLSVSAQVPVVDFITPSIVRVRWNPEGTLADNATGVCRYEPREVDVKTERRGDLTVIQSDSLRVDIADSGKMSFYEKYDGKVTEVLTMVDPCIAFRPFECDTVARERVVYDDSSARMEDTANGKVTVKDVLRRDTLGFSRRFRTSFINRDEALYGLGAHMEDYMNLMGKTLYLTQHNLKAFVPMLVSTKGYGLLFDAGCSMKFESCPLLQNARSTAHLTIMEMEAAETVDFYFIMGPSAEQVTAGYRYLTGSVAMMPRYLFGYIQSKERYVSSEDIVNTVKEYRRRHVPLDMIVQDWNYWPKGWGYMKMNREHYPNPKALADSVHALDARLMVSIWANPQYCPEEEDFRKRGFMLEHSVYDAFNPAARDLYWDYADKEFFSNGFDAWWCDSSEPLDGDWNGIPEPENGRPYSWNDHERRWRLNDAILSETLGAERACLYSLYHSRGIYEHQRAASDRKRVVNLTRSTFAGQQRYATIVWNGDTYASWDSFKRQIPAGLNYLATGNPYWTVDVGCFFTGKDGRWFRQGEFGKGMEDDGYKEFYTRMFQWGTFLPVLRSHGTDTPREIWRLGEPGTPWYDAVLDMINLRYSMLPYIYSMADAQTRSGFSMARPLAFDFPSDVNVFDISDQYMFGDIMVCPVTDPGVTSRKVYLPGAGCDWIDFWTGKRHEGGTTVMADAPIDRLPLFVKEGSIVLTTEPAEHSAASALQPVAVNIYPGKDAEFTFYDDGGDSYDFEKGECTRIRLKWNDRKRTLTIEDAEGTYSETPEKRLFYVCRDGKKKKVDYKGKQKRVKL